MTEEEKKREEAIANAEKALGEPVLAEMPEELRRTKRNMLALSAAMIFAYVSHLPLDLSTLPGIGEDAAHHAKWMWAGALLVLLYLTAQFVWQMCDYSVEARLRVTGTKLSLLTGAKDTTGIADFPDSPRQSSLMSWWIGNKELASRVSLALEDFERGVREVEGQDGFLIQVQKFNSEVAPKLEHFHWGRIEVSLGRFEHHFRNFGNSQRRRVLLLDILLPGILAVGALGVGGLGLWAAYTSENIAATINLLSAF